MAHLYRTLGVSDHSCTDEELKRAFQKKAMLWHPDRQPAHSKARAERMFKEVNAAYNHLVQLRSEDASHELHQAAQANPYTHTTARPAQGGFPGGAGNAQRDWQAHSEAYSAYARANRMPSDAPRRILLFCAGISAAGLLFNFAMLSRAQKEPPTNQLIAGRSSFITVSKPEIMELWDDARAELRGQGAGAGAAPSPFSGASLAAGIWRRTQGKG